jgi:hypothetical protein
MYDSLTTAELTALQDMLFAAVEEAYRVVNIKGGNSAWFERYRPMHQELGYLFIEAGEELLVRLDQYVQAA